MKNKWKSLGFIFLFLIGALILLYPDIADWWASRNHAGLIEQYQRTIEEVPDAEIEYHFELARTYNASLTGANIEDPFVMGSGFIIPDNYYEILNLHRSMGFIEIPAIDVRIPIYHGTDYDVLDRGIGHIPQTPFPIGEVGNHSVLTGHTGIPNSRLFTDLELLSKGDLFFVTIANQKMAYEIDQITIVLPHEISDLHNHPDKDLVTLVTCTPYAINSHRLLVRGQRTEYIPHVEANIESLIAVVNWRMILVASILSFFAISTLIYRWFYRPSLKSK